MRSVFSRNKDCCGCSACQQVCPQNAIAMMADEEGFLYPQIDQARCNNCGYCRKICPVIYPGNYKTNTSPCFYAARHTSQKVLQHSTSGGVFTAISDTILQQNGVIYGADYDENFRVLHRRATTPHQRNRMRISKYVQSNLGTTYASVKADLATGHAVLFTGTPCQCAGLRGMLGNSPLLEQLYISDLICHSIPSPLIWEEYKQLLEHENGGRLTSVAFRSKRHGWSRANSNKGFVFTTENTPDLKQDDRFYHLFFKIGAITRPACSQCRFTDINRTSDLTIADYWGIEKYSPSWFDPLGVSLVMINSSKGAALFEQCQQALHIEQRPQEEALNEQPRLHQPIRHLENRSTFWADYRQHGFQYVMQKHT